MVLQNNQAIHCPTSELATKVLQKLHRQGIKWNSGKSLAEIDNRWHYYGADTCFSDPEGLYYGTRSCSILDNYEIIPAAIFLGEYWCIKVDRSEVVDYCNQYGVTPGTYRILDNTYAHYPNYNGWTSCSSVKPGYTEITFNDFKKYILNMENKKIIGYKSPMEMSSGKVKVGDIFALTHNKDQYYFCPKDGVNIVLPKEIVEMWEPVYEEKFKVGDYIYVTNHDFMIPSHCEKSISKGEVRKIVSLDKRDDIDYPYQITLEGGSFGGHRYAWENSGYFRKATPDEIEAATCIEINGYKGEKLEGQWKFGCQYITDNHIQVVRDLLKAPINAKITIGKTEITKELLNRLK